jgi:hypothetical protein
MRAHELFLLPRNKSAWENWPSGILANAGTNVNLLRSFGHFNHDGQQARCVDCRVFRLPSARYRKYLATFL